MRRRNIARTWTTPGAAGLGHPNTAASGLGRLAGKLTGRLGTTRRDVYSAAFAHGIFAIAPFLLTAWCLRFSFHSGSTSAVDFHHEFWVAASRVIDGQNPYAPGWQHITAGVAFPYPAFTSIAFIPLALMPHELADVVYTALNLAAVMLTLFILGVRDWRIFGLTFLSAPIVTAWQSANLTLVLALGIAFLWRARDRPVMSGFLVAALISLKPFVWPLALWLIATRRWAALAYGALWGAAINLVAWSVVGFSQLQAYRHVAGAVTRVMEHRGYSLLNLALHAGAGTTVSFFLTVALTVCVIGGCVIVARQGQEFGALSLSLGAALLATPVLWTHYFGLLIVPLAIARPRLCLLWFMPMLLWLCPSTTPDTWQIVLALGVGAATVASVASRPRGLTGAPASRRLRFG
jgi:hypothetical protein